MGIQNWGIISPLTCQRVYFNLFQLTSHGGFQVSVRAYLLHDVSTTLCIRMKDHESRLPLLHVPNTLLWSASCQSVLFISDPSVENDQPRSENDGRKSFELQDGSLLMNLLGFSSAPLLKYRVGLVLLGGIV